MFVDKRNFYSDGQAIGNGASENVLDFGKGGDAYEAMWLAVSLSPALPAGQEFAVEVESADKADFSDGVVLAVFPGKEEAGFAVAERLPRGCKRYSRLKYTADASLSGTVTAYLAADLPTA